MPVTKKSKTATARKNAEAMKAAKKQQRMAKGTSVAVAAPKNGNKKGPSLIKQTTKKK